MKTIIRVALLLVLVSSVVSCIPALIGGAFYSANESKKSCRALNRDPNLLEKLKIPEFKEHYRKTCKQRDTDNREVVYPDNEDYVPGKDEGQSDDSSS